MLVLGLLAAACGDDDGATTTGFETGITSDIRFTFAPDPGWDWIVDQGIQEEMEAESGIRIIQSITWDEFGLFAGGHADIVSMGSFEVPVLEFETGVKTVSFSKYNLSRDIVVVPGDEPWETFNDLPPGCRVGVETFVGSTTVWQAFVADQYGRDLSEGSSDLQMLLADFAVIPDLVIRGDVCAGISGASTAGMEIIAGDLKPLYEGKGASQLYGEFYQPGHAGMTSNQFLSLLSWYEDHPEEVAFFNEVWQVAVDEWHANIDEIVESYPQHFTAESPEHLAFVKDWYHSIFNFFVTDVYLTEEWIKGEAEVFNILVRAGIVPESQTPPLYVCIDPATGEETCRINAGGDL
jgi:hypothetical protein